MLDLHRWRFPVGGFIAAAAVFFVVVMLVGPHGNPPNEPTSAFGGERVWLDPAGSRTKALLFRSESISRHPDLIVVLHGDAPKERPGYQYRFAAHVAAALPDTVAAGLLRPGYTDPTGDRSEGERGRATADNYTPAVIAQLAGAIAQLQAQVHPGRTILVGHSGGAALAALLMERHPELATHALLVSCPCDLPAFRDHMARLQLNPLWLLPVKSVSPIAEVTQLRPEARLRVVVGSADEVTPPPLSRAFAAAAGQHAHVALVIVPGAPHDMLFAPEVMRELRKLEAE